MPPTYATNGGAKEEKNHVHVMDLHNGTEPAALAQLGQEKRLSQQLLKFLQIQDFRSPEAWRSALMESAATAAFVFLSICITISCSQQSTSPMAYISILHFIMISFLILAAAASSGGHLNPCISFIAMVLGYISPSRTLMYTVAQCSGSLLGTLFMKLVLSHEAAHRFSLGGCAIRNAQGAGIPVGSAFVAETSFTFVLIFVVATVALDPYRAHVTGPILAPMLIAAAVGFLVFISGGLAIGYSGAGMNPARCLGPAVIMGGELWYGHWVFWVAPYVATFAVAILYCFIPPHHVEIYRGRKDIVTRIMKAFNKHHTQAVSTE